MGVKKPFCSQAPSSWVCALTSPAARPRYLPTPQPRLSLQMFVEQVVHTPLGWFHKHTSLTSHRRWGLVALPCPLDASPAPPGLVGPVPQPGQETSQLTLDKATQLLAGPCPWRLTLRHGLPQRPHECSFHNLSRVPWAARAAGCSHARDTATRHTSESAGDSLTFFQVQVMLRAPQTPPNCGCLSK